MLGREGGREGGLNFDFRRNQSEKGTWMDTGDRETSFSSLVRAYRKETRTISHHRDVCRRKFNGAVRITTLLSHGSVGAVVVVARSTKREDRDYYYRE